MRKRARTGLSGGRSARIVPTGSTDRFLGEVWSLDVCRQRGNWIKPGEKKWSRIESVAMKHAMSKSMSWALAAFLFLPLLSAEDATGSVSGTVVCADGNSPARGAKVAVIPVDQLLSRETGSAPGATTSDFSGTYEIRAISPGTYIVNATLDGYSDDLKLVLSVLNMFSLDDKRKLLAAFPQVTVKAGTATRKDLVLRRAAAISGHVTVDFGGLAGRVQVTAARIVSLGSASSPISIASGSEPFTQSSLTDDRGEFRIAGLPAGQYRISVRITETYFGSVINKGEVHVQPQRSGTAELKVYAPEALEEGHTRIFRVNEGDEITDADITIPTRILHSIGGIATEVGVPAAGVSISIEREGTSIEGSDAVSMPDGSYRFDLLPPGNYILRAKHGRLSGHDAVQLQDSDILDANINLHGPSTQMQ